MIEDFDLDRELFDEDYADLQDPKDVEDTDICPRCSGSGEGMHDGSTCELCKGKGEI